MSKRTRVALSLASLLLSGGILSGCTPGRTQFRDQVSPFAADAPNTPPPACPKVEMVPELRRLYRFPSGSSPAAGAELFAATLTGIDSGCAMDMAGAKVWIGLTIAGRRGPAMVLPYGEHGSSVEVTYFAAIVDPAGKIIDKTTYPTRLDFKDGLRPTATERLEQRIVAAPAMLGKYTIEIGLQMGPEEIGFVRGKEQLE